MVPPHGILGTHIQSIMKERQRSSGLPDAVDVFVDNRYPYLNYGL
jgi:hypothetical protein